MTIGIPKEIKSFENRVGLIPQYVKSLVSEGHRVFVQQRAGLKSGIPDEAYSKAGADLVSSVNEVYQNAQLIVKVKEPQIRERKLIREGQILFSFFHFPASETLLDDLIQAKAIAVAYETVEDSDKSLPILSPMSSIAGKLAVQMGMNQLENIAGGKGVLLGGIPGVSAGKVLILGAGTVGTNACYVAANLRANVTMLDIDFNRLRQLQDVMPNNVELLYSNEDNLRKALTQADLVICAVHQVGMKPPILINRELLHLMENDSVIVDVAIDQGGSTEFSRPTTHLEPTFKEEGIIHYCVPNMPSIVARTATAALSHTIFPFVQSIARHGLIEAASLNPALRKGICLYQGNVTNRNVADTFQRSYHEIRG